jgi:hypothetical protein
LQNSLDAVCLLATVASALCCSGAEHGASRKCFVLFYGVSNAIVFFYVRAVAVEDGR